MFSSSLIALVLAAIPSTLATVFTTSPVATTSWAAGQSVTVSWQDDNTSPTIASFGAATIGVYAGSVQQQTLLQLISSSVDVSTTSSVQFTPDGSIGPNSGDYFIRFASLNLKDSTNSQFPAEAFSSKFTLTGMTGTFNATVQSQINAAASAASGSSSSTASASATTSAATSASHSSSATSKTASVSASASSTAKAQTANTSGAGRAVVSGTLGLAVVAAAVSSLFL
ncbi:hypothetical protein EW146_g2179 [Bondarzewia mesenterica]|uniref:Yeast cell wall synthesis Kre9/Knh1-like N-terminal domain-containing protein n=1 Tax=Bondarzewia mesenterica TaxID=1095465 RepID=A0A4S4M2Y3_9AGAM|nr:hypothetical protein EW146_g2179 [Bondarzewia mesenterica]